MTDAESKTDYRTHPTYLCGLAAVCAEPACDVERLKLADWLDEHGQDKRADFIRMQVVLRLYVDLSLEPAKSLHGYMRRLFDGQLGFNLRDQLPFMRHTVEWSTFHGRTDRCCFYSRGFVSHVTLPAVDWFQHHEALCWSPSETMECPKCKDVEHNYPAGLQAEVFARCQCSGAGRVTRPIPPTAQPLEVVRLTEIPHARFSQTGWNTETARLLLARGWPRIRFLLPGDTDE